MSKILIIVSMLLLIGCDNTMGIRHIEKGIDKCKDHEGLYKITNVRSTRVLIVSCKDGRHYQISSEETNNG